MHVFEPEQYIYPESSVTNYNNPASLGSAFLSFACIPCPHVLISVLAVISWTIPFTAVATSVAAILTQFFLGHRVYILTKNSIITGVIGLFSVLGFVFGWYAGIRSGIIAE